MWPAPTMIASQRPAHLVADRRRRLEYSQSGRGGYEAFSCRHLGNPHAVHCGSDRRKPVSNKYVSELASQSRLQAVWNMRLLAFEGPVNELLIV